MLKHKIRKFSTMAMGGSSKKEDMSPRETHNDSKRKKLISGIFLGLLLFLYIGFSRNGNGNGSGSSTPVTVVPKDQGYIVVIDAGSSGSRGHVFRYNRGTPKRMIDPQHESYKAKPGLSSYASNPHEAGESLMPLIQFCKEKIPREQFGQTRVLLKATAGLRKLTQKQRDDILEAVRETLSESGLQFESQDAQVIDGSEEGLLGWMSVNYLNNDDDDKTNSSNGWSVLEMGGASLQVTQPLLGNTNHKKQMPSELLREYSFPGKRSSSGSVYTHSFLGLGMEEARKSVNQALVTSSQATAVNVEDPCLPEGFTACPEDDRWDPLCGTSSDKVAPAGNYEKCAALISRTIFNANAETNVVGAETANNKDCPYEKAGTGRCLFNGLYAPSFAGSKNALKGSKDNNNNKVIDQLWAFENFYYVLSGIGFQVSEGTVRVSEILQQAQKVCGMSWDATNESYPKDKQSKDSNRKWCFGTTYVYLFLTQGFGLSDQQTLIARNEINGNGIDWALGAALQAMKGSYNENNLRGGY